MQRVKDMKRPPFLLLLFSCGLSLLFSSCSSPPAAIAGHTQMQSGGDAITGTVVSSSPEHMLIRIDDLPQWALEERAAADAAYASR